MKVTALIKGPKPPILPLIKAACSRVPCQACSIETLAETVGVRALCTLGCCFSYFGYADYAGYGYGLVTDRHVTSLWGVWSERQEKWERGVHINLGSIIRVLIAPNTAKSGSHHNPELAVFLQWKTSYSMAWCIAASCLQKCWSSKSLMRCENWIGGVCRFKKDHR